MQGSIFKSEPADPQRWRHFATSYSLQLVGIILLAQIAFEAPQVMPQRHYESIQLYLNKPEPEPQHMMVQKIAPPPPAVIKRITPPKVELPQRDTPPVVAKIEPPRPLPLAPKVETAHFDTPPAPEPKPRGNPTRPIEVGAFSGSSAMPTIKAPVREVQTGGFGDPNGIAGKPTNDHPALVAARVGAFDLPQGGGYGNGSGGEHGRPGVVASAGFGDGVAGPGSGDRGGTRGGSVRSAGFDNAGPVARETRTAQAPAAAPVTGVEILEKPLPTYTEEARRMKIEGEVLVKVVFLSSGHVEIVGVVRGLGHGLDEAAQNAAHRIKFKPALRAGQPVDYPATVHIVFELAG